MVLVSTIVLSEEAMHSKINTTGLISCKNYFSDELCYKYVKYVIGLKTIIYIQINLNILQK